jgi:hypothetical protein
MDAGEPAALGRGAPGYWCTPEASTKPAVCDGDVLLEGGAAKLDPLARDRGGFASGGKDLI